MITDYRPLEEALQRLQLALAKGSTTNYCLHLWSRFIRLRDNECCVICGSDDGLNAHHILRKSFMPEAQFQTGNGISLCVKCHAEPHKGFNRRPDISLPMDEQNGEKIEVVTGFFRSLMEDAIERGQLRDDFYFLSEQVLSECKMFQGFDPHLPLEGSRLEQAYSIWLQTPRNTLSAVLKANGMKPRGSFRVGTMNVYFE